MRESRLRRLQRRHRRSKPPRQSLRYVYRIAQATLKSDSAHRESAEGESADRTPGVKLSGTHDRGGVPLRSARAHERTHHDRRPPQPAPRHPRRGRRRVHRLRRLADAGALQLRPRRAPRRAHRRGPLRPRATWARSSWSGRRPPSPSTTRSPASSPRSSEGQAKYTLLLSREGGIIDDLVVYRTGADRFLVVANARQPRGRRRAAARARAPRSTASSRTRATTSR